MAVTHSEPGVLEIPESAAPVPSGIRALRPVRSLLTGVLLLMAANGLQATLIALRAEAEGFRPASIGIITSAYFAGFLVGSRMAPGRIRSIGHVRAFGTLASAASALVLVHALAVTLPVWIVARFLSGICVSGLLVVIESWLNSSAAPAARGRMLSAYMLATTVGYAGGQGLLLVGNIDEFTLFALVSVLLSVSLMPVLMSSRSGPTMPSAAAMPIRDLIRLVPTSAVTSFTAGLAWGSLAGLGAVIATSAGLRGAGISLFVAAFLIGQVFAEPFVGAVSDRFDRRVVVSGVASLGAGGAVVGALFVETQPALIAAAVVVGAGALPLYGLAIAIAGDRLRHEDLVGGSVALVQINGLGAALGPLVVAAVTGLDPRLFMLMLAIVLGGLAVVTGAGRSITARLVPRVPYARLPARASTTVAGTAARFLERRSRTGRGGRGPDVPERRRTG